MTLNEALAAVNVNPAMLGITALIAVIAVAVTAYKKHNEAIQESIQKAQELQDAYKEASAEISDNISTVKDLTTEFNELSKGVGDHGENISLSSDEYERYLDIIKQLVDINPTLVKGYDAEGNAIIEKNAAIQATIDLLKEEQALKLAEATTDENSWDIAEGLKNSYKQALDELDDASSELALAFEEALLSNLEVDESQTGLASIAGRNVRQVYSELEKMFGVYTASENDDITLTQWDALFNAIAESSETSGKIIADNISYINSLLDKNSGAASALSNALLVWQTASKTADTAASAYQSHMKVIAQAAAGYDELSNSSKDFVNTWIESQKLTSDISREEVDALTDNIQKIVNLLASGVTIDGKEVDLNKELDKLFTVDWDSLGGEWYNAARDKAETVIEQLAKALDLTDKQVADLRVSLGLTFVDPATGNPVDVHDYYVNLVSDQLQGKIDFSGTDISGLNTVELKAALRLNPSDYSSWIAFETAVKELAAGMAELTDTVYDFKTSIESIASYEDAYAQLSATLSEFSENGAVSAETVSDLLETFGDTEALRDFISVLGQESVTADQVKEALDGLGKECLSNAAILSQLTEDNAGWVAAALKANGVANAQEVIANRLAAQQLELQYSTELASMATWDEISAFLQEKGASAQVISALSALRTEQLRARVASIDFASASQSVTSALLAQAKAAGASAEAIKYLSAIQGLQKLNSQLTNEDSIEKNNVAIANMQAKLDALLASSEGSVDFEFSVTPVYSGGSSSSDSSDPWKDEFEAYYNAHKHAVAMEQETLADFYAWLDGQSGYKKYFANNEKYLDEFYQYSEEVFEGLRDLAEDAIDDGLHQITLWENQGGHEVEIVTKLRELQDELHSTAEAARKAMRDAGWSELEIENSDIVSSLGEQWWDLDAQIKDVFDSVSDTVSDYINDVEHQIYLLEQQAGDTGDNTAIIAQYAGLEAYILKQIDELTAKMKALGYTETEIANSGAIQELQKQLYDAKDAVDDILDTLNGDLYDSMKSLLDLTIEMIRQEKEDEKEALEQLVDDYATIISQRKEMLQLAERERQYNEDVADKTSEIAKLQARIDALSRDDSRTAAIEKAALEEQLADLQRELTDLQRDHSIEATEDALDTELENFEATQQDKIDAIDDFLDDQQALTKAALARLDNMNQNLFNDLLSYALHYTSTTQAELEDMWNSALAAAQNYGAYVEAMNAAESGSYYTSSSVGGGSTSGGGASATALIVEDLIAQMKANSASWYASGADQGYLASQNEKLAQQISSLIGEKVVRGDDGVWYIGSVGGAKLYDDYKKYCYHTGGVVGGNSVSTPKQDEVLALLKKREIVLNETQQSNLIAMLEQLKPLGVLKEVLSSVKSNSFGAVTAGAVPSIDASIHIDGSLPDDQMMDVLRRHQRTVANLIMKYFTS